MNARQVSARLLASSVVFAAAPAHSEAIALGHPFGSGFALAFFGLPIVASIVLLLRIVAGRNRRKGVVPLGVLALVVATVVVLTMVGRIQGGYFEILWLFSPWIFLFVVALIFKAINQNTVAPNSMEQVRKRTLRQRRHEL